jgi:thermostable 8-oxoguanine DNA glycosylase
MDRNLATIMEEDEMLKLFADFSVVFKTFFTDPSWKKYENILEDHLEAASFFFGGYGFEHQGRSPSYPPASIEAIKLSKGFRDSQDFPLIVWNNFSKLLNNEKLNLDRNPLYHVQRNSLCHRYPSISCNCIWCALEKSENIVLISKQDLEAGDIKNAWERLKRIRGVGNKIASLFLRDVAIRYGLTLGNNDDRWLLQPIDIWVRRVVQSRKNEETSDEKIARWIVENCKKPEQCNQGIWYFGARIAGSDFGVNPDKINVDHVKDLLREHIAVLKTTCSAAMKFESEKL